MDISIPDELNGVDKQKEIRFQMLKFALEKNNYHQLNTAKWLGISPRSIRYWLKEFPELKRLPKYILEKLPESLDECKQTMFYRYMDDHFKRMVEVYYLKKSQ